MSFVENKKILKDKYEFFLNDFLGSGAFGSVYKGRNLINNEEVAIKVINRQAISKYGVNMIKSIGQEVTILQKISENINSPNIIKIYDCFQTQSNIYIILEICKDGIKI